VIRYHTQNYSVKVMSSVLNISTTRINRIIAKHRKGKVIGKWYSEKSLIKSEHIEFVDDLL